MSTTRVPLSEVSDLMAPGQPLPFRVLDGVGRLLLSAGQVVHGVAQLKQLLERGACVEFVEAQAVRQARAGQSAAGALTPSSRRRSIFDRWEQLTWSLDAQLRKLGRDAGQAAPLTALVDEHVALLDRHPDGALFICVRQDDRRFALYGLTHAIHTATIVALCARLMGWPPGQVRSVVGAALTMNASITELQAQMAEQSDPPGKRQLDQIRTHPTRSAELLRTSGVDDAAWLRAVEQHHEQPGGGGYPAGLVDIDEGARVLRAADVFAAKISPRALRAPLLPQLAARQLFQQESGGPVAAALIKAVGVYPPGDFVKLKNGEIGIVIQRPTASRGAVVVALQSAVGKSVPGSPKRDTAQPDFAIAGPLTERAGMPRVLPESVYGMIDA